MNSNSIKKRFGSLLPLSILLGIGFLFLTAESCPETKNWCFEVELPQPCNQALNARLKLSGEYLSFNSDGTLNSGVPFAPIEEYVIPRTERFMGGMEVNWGDYSKDSHYEWSYAELFKWKYGRWPTPSEEATITDEQAQQWFHERHDQYYNWVFFTEKKSAYDLKKREVSSRRVCIPVPVVGGNIPNYRDVHIAGLLTFPNGKTCELEPKDFYLNGTPYVKDGSNNVVKLKVKLPCAGCN